jgi:V/A-type H+-transporting ATPase subunit E
MDKLQELTQKLYEEGLSKGKAEGEQILQNAQAKADEIIKAAHEEADAIIAKARKEAEDHRTKVEGDVKMAATQTIQETKAAIENLIMAKAVDAPAKAAIADTEYIKGIISAVAAKFSAEQDGDLSLVLPEALKEQLEPYVKAEIAKIVGGGVDVAWSGKIAGGFRIGPKDGSYYISFSDESFAELIGSYLRPATKRILFDS